MKHSLWYALVLGVLILLGSSCSKDDEQIPEYVGTWEFYFTSRFVDTTGGTEKQISFRERERYIYNEGDYVVYYETYDSTATKWVQTFVEAGTLTDDNGILLFKVTEVQVLTQDPIIGFRLITYGDGDGTLNAFLLATSYPGLYDGDFQIDSQGDMIISFDYGRDGEADYQRILEPS